MKLEEKALRLNPFAPTWYRMNLGHSYRVLGRYEEAIAEYKKSLAPSPNSLRSWIYLCSTYVDVGRMDEARAAAKEVMRISPKFSVDYESRACLFIDKDFCDRHVENLRKAGLK